MGWYKFMAERHDEYFSSGIDRSGASRKYYDIPMRRPDGSRAKPESASIPLLSFGVKLTLAFFIMWLLAYISAAFPYLGTSSYSHRNGWRESFTFGTNHMLLFKGQTAFIDYEVDSQKGFDGTVFIDIAPWPGLKFSSNMRRVDGKSRGVVSYTVPKTGVYTYNHSIGPMAYGEKLSYSATWGAR